MLSHETRPAPLHIGRFAKLVAALPMVEHGDGTVSAEWFGGSYQGLKTLADLWECKPKSAALTLKRLRESGINAEAHYRNHGHRFTLGYAATTGAQMPTVLASLTGTPTASGDAVTFYLSCSHLSGLTQPLTVAGQSELVGIDPRRIKAARATLRTVRLLDEQGRIVRIGRKTEGAKSGGAQGAKSGVFPNRDTPLNTPTGYRSSFLHNSVSENQEGGKNQNHHQVQQQRRPRANEIRETMDALLADAGPTIESKATGSLKGLISNALTGGITTEELVARYGGYLKQSMDPIAVVRHRIQNDIRHQEPAHSPSRLAPWTPSRHVPQPTYVPAPRLSAREIMKAQDELKRMAEESAPPELSAKESKAKIAVIRRQLANAGSL